MRLHQQRVAVLAVVLGCVSLVIASIWTVLPGPLASRSVPRDGQVVLTHSHVPPTDSALLHRYEERLTQVKNVKTKAGSPLYEGRSVGGLRYLAWHSTTEYCRVTTSWIMVYLHGAGEIGTDIREVYSSLGGRGTIPNLIIDRRRDDDGGGRSGNVHDADCADRHTHPLLNGSLGDVLVLAPQSSEGWTSSDAELTLVHALIQDHLTAPHRSGCPRAPVDGGGAKAHVVVTGVSQGGYAVLRMIELYGRSIVAAVALCGFSFSLPVLLGAVGNCDTTAVMLAHGSNDIVVPARESRRIFQELSATNCRKYVARYSKATSHVGIPTDGALLRSRFALVEYDQAADPLDGNEAAAGHAVWRDLYAASSPLWPWLSSRQ